jgi:hypothetical protein
MSVRSFQQLYYGIPNCPFLKKEEKILCSAGCQTSTGYYSSDDKALLSCDTWVKMPECRHTFHRTCWSMNIHELKLSDSHLCPICDFPYSEYPLRPIDSPLKFWLVRLPTKYMSGKSCRPHFPLKMLNQILLMASPGTILDVSGIGSNDCLLVEGKNSVSKVMTDKDGNLLISQEFIDRYGVEYYDTMASHLGVNIIKCHTSL